MTQPVDDDLDAAWRPLRQSLQGTHAPSTLDDALLAAFRTRHTPTRMARLRQSLASIRWTWLSAGGAMAAALVATLWMRPVLMERGQMPLSDTASPALAEAELTTAFFPVGDPRRIQAAAHARMVRVSLPRAVMAEYGLPVSPELADQPVEADLLVGDDGATMALRFVRTNLSVM
ncbi:hypothetical protein [Chitinimonas sp. BJYL2]|uniref:hypothetical protein n=1 Tax=Chitinimonas sp. BJYL2 TaxID=2976696 RepID=UPI0022B5A47E|nr:hypothetical protein [Chitinimonas sp. BJYL2]